MKYSKEDFDNFFDAIINTVNECKKLTEDQLNETFVNDDIINFYVTKDKESIKPSLKVF